MFVAVALALALVAQTDAEAALSDARRAVAKDPVSAAAKKALKTAFVEARHALIDRTRDFEKLTVTCPALRGSIGTESCIRDHVERMVTSSSFVEVEGDELVAAVVLPGYEELFLTEGVVRGVHADGDVVSVDLDVIRERGPRDPAVESVLFLASAQKGAPPEWSGPILSRDARRLLASVPDHFTVLDGEPSHRFVQELCGGKPSPTFALSQSLVGQASYLDNPAGSTAVTAVVDVKATGNGIKLALKAGKPVDLQWPTSEKDVALVGGTAWGTSASKFPSKQAKNCPK
jgi:hypothetical protein